MRFLCSFESPTAKAMGRADVRQWTDPYRDREGAASGERF